jgi:hypothetical protein
MNIEFWMVFRHASLLCKKDARVCPKLGGIVQYFTAVAVVGSGPSARFDNHFIAELKKLFNDESRYRRIFR